MNRKLMGDVGVIPDNCPVCKKGKKEYGVFDPDPMCYDVTYTDCEHTFWEAPESILEWGEQI